MAPWIVIAVAALVGAAMGGVGGFFAGLGVGFAFSLVVGTLYNRAQTRVQREAAAETLRQVGAPPPPYPLDPLDRVCAERIAAMLPNCRVVESQGPYGPQLELMIPTLSREPLAMFSRTWDPDKRRVGTVLMCAGNVEPPVIAVAREHGLEPVGAPGPFTLFTRF